MTNLQLDQGIFSKGPAPLGVLGRSCSPAILLGAALHSARGSYSTTLFFPLGRWGSYRFPVRHYLRWRRCRPPEVSRTTMAICRAIVRARLGWRASSRKSVKGIGPPRDRWHTTDERGQQSQKADKHTVRSLTSTSNGDLRPDIRISEARRLGFQLHLASPTLSRKLLSARMAGATCWSLRGTSESTASCF
jgi:hypothetical protein